MSAEQSIAFVLRATRVAHAVGTRPSVDMSPENISKAIGKSVKTVRNTLAMMGKTGIVERTNEGNYKLSMQGIRKSHEIRSEERRVGKECRARWEGRYEKEIKDEDRE